MRQHIVSQDGACGASLGKRSQWLGALVRRHQRKQSQRSRKRLDDFRGVSHRKIYILRKARCEKVVLRHPVFLAATIDADDAPAFRPTEAASKWCCIRWRCQSPICVRDANCGPVCLRFPLFRLEIERLRECSGSWHRASGVLLSASGKCGFPGSFDAPLAQ